MHMPCHALLPQASVLPMPASKIGPQPDSVLQLWDGTRKGVCGGWFLTSGNTHLVTGHRASSC
jgi:hypothetical protein